MSPYQRFENLDYLKMIISLIKTRRIVMVKNALISTCAILWLAILEINAQGQCTQEDSVALASYYSSLTQALVIGDFANYLNLINNYNNLFQELSPPCQKAMASILNSSASNQIQGTINNPSIYDNGAGTIIVPGVGASTPNGIIPLGDE
jgi:hypothetical protein